MATGEELERLHCLLEERKRAIKEEEEFREQADEIMGGELLRDLVEQLDCVYDLEMYLDGTAQGDEMQAELGSWSDQAEHLSAEINRLHRLADEADARADEAGDLAKVKTQEIIDFTERLTSQREINRIPDSDRGESGINEVEEWREEALELGYNEESYIKKKKKKKKKAQNVRASFYPSLFPFSRDTNEEKVEEAPHTHIQNKTKTERKISFAFKRTEGWLELFHKKWKGGF